jgi:hypothetical protein
VLSASSRRMQVLRPASLNLSRAARSSLSAGITVSGTPTLRSKAPRASAGATGSSPALCAPSDTKTCAWSAWRSRSRRAACTASAVLPTPAIPLITTTGSEDRATSVSSHDVSFSISAARPVKSGLSRGMVLGGGPMLAASAAADSLNGGVALSVGSSSSMSRCRSRRAGPRSTPYSSRQRCSAWK